MFAFRSARHSATVRLLVVAVSFAFAVTAQNGLRLVRVPDRVVLPPPPGSNLLVEVAVTGAPDSIWLARDRDQIGGVKLTESGDGRYQVNLADARVLRLMHPERRDGEFRVFARFGTEVLASTAIGWSRGLEPASSVQCLIVGVDGTKAKATKDRVRWLEPSRIERLEIHGAAAPAARVMAFAGTTDLPLAWRKDDRLFVLELNDGLRRSLCEAGHLTLEVRVGEETILFDHRVVPDRLRPVDEPTVTVLQRRTAVIPGSSDWLEVRLGDITMGRVLLTITDAEGRTVVEPVHVAEHDPVPFELSGAKYVLAIDRMVNRLIGDDYAELSVTEAAKFTPDPIALLIKRVEAATDIAFVREGKDYPSAMAAQLLRARLGSHRGARPTPAEFVVMGGTSSSTGNPYLVRLADGTEVKAEAWLRSLLTEIERELAEAAREVPAKEAEGRMRDRSSKPGGKGGEGK